MSYEFWLGLLFCIPVSIVVDLATPGVQALMAKGTSSWALRQKRSISKDLERIRRYREQRHLFVEDILNSLASMAVMGMMTVCLLLSFMLRYRPDVATDLGRQETYLDLVINILFLLCLNIVVVILISIRTDMWRLHHFEEYEKRVMEIIGAGDSTAP